jgi:hypothetical protein
MAATNPARKRVVLMLLLLGAGLSAERIATLAMAGDDAAEEAPVRARAPGAKPAPAAGSTAGVEATATLRLDRLETRETALRARIGGPPVRLARAGPFDTVSWAPPPPPPAQPPPPARPTAPPFPYAYIGSMQDAGIRTAFFNQGERALAVKVGDVVDGRFRVDQMSDLQMQLTYLPLNEGMTVALGGPR